MSPGPVTFAELGLHGRLGNQLWQIAGTIGRAIDLGREVRLPPWAYTGAFQVPADWFGPAGPDALEVFDTVGYLRPGDRRYLQDTRLWWSHRDRIRKYFTLAPVVVEACLEAYPRLRDPGSVTAVHVRRGDYVKWAKIYPLYSVDYYRAALSEIPPADTVVLTDDPDWVADEMPFLRDAAHLSAGAPNVVDLACMTLCGRQVIANSSFSWWGAFLSGSTDVRYPRHWYTPEFAHLASEHLFPAQWTALN